MISILLFWGVSILGAVCAVQWLLDWQPGQAEKERPLDILTARYVRGEISLEEFVKRKKALE